MVPRLFEMLRAKMIKAIEKDGGLPDICMGARSHRAKRYEGGAAVGPADGRFLSLTLRTQGRAKFGGRIKAMVSGGAPLNPDVGIFFQALGLTLLQGYGQTEAGPVISCNRPERRLRMETVGPPLMNTEVRIAEDGEIMVRGESVMHGYWRNPEETRAGAHRRLAGHRRRRPSRRQGPDRHHRPQEGSDRQRQGRQCLAQRVEGMLTLQPEIAQAMVFGDRRPHLVGLLVPETEIVAGSRTTSWPSKALGQAVDRVNADSERDRTGPPLHPRRRAVHGRERATDPVDEDPPPRHRQAYGERLDALYKR